MWKLARQRRACIVRELEKDGDWESAESILKPSRLCIGLGKVICMRKRQNELTIQPGKSDLSGLRPSTKPPKNALGGMHGESEWGFDKGFAYEDGSKSFPTRFAPGKSSDFQQIDLVPLRGEIPRREIDEGITTLSMCSGYFASFRLLL